MESVFRKTFFLAFIMVIFLLPGCSKKADAQSGALSSDSSELQSGAAQSGGTAASAKSGGATASSVQPGSIDEIIARMEQLKKESEILAERMEKDIMTEKDYARLLQIPQEYLKLDELKNQLEIAADEEESRLSYRKENKGWPPASIYQKRFGLGAFRQPAGTTAYYWDSYPSDKKDEVNSLHITMEDATDVALADLKKQVEVATKKPMEWEENRNYPEDSMWRFTYDDPFLKGDASIHYWISVELQPMDGDLLVFRLLCHGTRYY